MVGKHGISLQKIKVWVCLLCAICSQSNGKGLVSVGFQDCIIPLMNLVEKTSPDATLNTIRFINNHTAIAAGQNKNSYSF
jgi:hypothetical protein